MAIQPISPVPEAGHRGVDIQTTFVTKQENFQDHLRLTLVPELNQYAQEISDVAINAINVITLTTIEDLATYTGTGLVMVKDINRGGTFVSKTPIDIDPNTGSLYTVNNVTVFAKLGGGFWARQYQGEIKPEWAGYDLALIDNETSLLSYKNAGGKSNGSVSFVFDDGYVSFYNDIAPLFDSYGLKCGFAIYTSGINTSGKLTKGQLIELHENGFEIVNHAYDGNVLSDVKGKQFVKAQINTAISYFNNIGIKCNCWQTPSSALGSDFYELLKNKFTFSFTRTAPFRPIKGDESNKLFRHSLESLTLSQCKTLVQAAMASGGSVVFYAHNSPVGSDMYNLTNTLIQYCNTLGVEIKTPSESLKDGVLEYKEKDYIINKGNIVLDTKGNFTTSFGTLTIDANKEIIVTTTGSGLSIIQTTDLVNNFIDSDGGEMTFSTGIRCTSGTFGENSSIGIKLTHPTSGLTLYQDEETIPTIGNSYLRFNIKAPNIGKCKVLIYVRADFTSAGEIRLNKPILRMGNDVTPPDAKKEISTLNVLTIPTQTITAGNYSTSNNIALTDQADNGLFEIVSGVLKFTRTAKVSITASVSAYGTGVLTGSKGGGLFVKIGNTGQANAFSSPLNIGADCGGGSVSLTMTVCNYNNLIMSLFNIGCNFPISTTFSRLTIVEILD